MTLNDIPTDAVLVCTSCHGALKIGLEDSLSDCVTCSHDQAQCICPKGTRVSNQPNKWFDGRPVKDWPSPSYVGTVVKIELLAGLYYAVVKWDSGRKDRELVTRLLKVS